MLRQQDPDNPASTTNGAISQIVSVSPATPCYASLKGKRKIVFDAYGGVSVKDHWQVTVAPRPEHDSEPASLAVQDRCFALTSIF